MVFSKRLVCPGTVAYFEAIHVFVDCSDRARSISAKHVRKCGFDSSYFDKSAFTLIRVPRSYAGSFDAAVMKMKKLDLEQMKKAAEGR